jgi:hypothetical protein
MRVKCAIACARLSVPHDYFGPQAVVAAERAPNLIPHLFLMEASLRWNNGRLHRSNYAIPDKSSNFEQGGRVMHLHIRAGGEREPPSVEIILPNGVKR